MTSAIYFKNKKVICITILLLILNMLLPGCSKQNVINIDIVNFEGNEYKLLEYPENEFYYDYNGNSHDNFEEVDGRYPIDSPQWNMIWNAGDLYCAVDRVEEAENYYSNDDNYEWYIVINTEDDELSYPINVNDDELESIYKLEEMERTTSLFWEEFEAQGSLIKISKDSIVRGTISIIKFNGSWYWKSEVIDESREKDGDWPEYVQPLPETLNNKIE